MSQSTVAWVQNPIERDGFNQVYFMWVKKACRGIDVKTYGTVNEALAAFGSEKFDLVIMDPLLRFGDDQDNNDLYQASLTLVERIKGTRNKDTPIFVLSNHSIRDQEITTKVDEVLYKVSTKPWDLQEVIGRYLA
jgi:DNA-binding response OmpR family regulator